MFDGVLGSSTDVCLTEAPDLLNDHLPINVFSRERSEATGDDAPNHLSIRESIFEHIVESTKQCPIQEFRVICGGDNEAVGVVFLKQLQERIQDPPYLADIIGLCPLRSQRIEFIKQIDAFRCRDRIEYELELSRRL